MTRTILTTTCLFALAATAGVQPLDPLEAEQTQPKVQESDEKALQSKILRDEMTIERLNATLHTLEKEIEEREDRIADLASEGMGTYALTTDSERMQLVGRMLGRLLDIRLDIAAEEAVAPYLQNCVETATETAHDLESERVSLEHRLQALALQRDRLRKAVDDGTAVERSEALAVERSVANLRIELEKLAKGGGTNTEETTRLASRLSESRVRLLERRAREKLATEQLQQAKRAAAFAPKLRRERRKLDRLVVAVESRWRHVDELVVELEKNRALLQALRKSGVEAAK